MPRRPIPLFAEAGLGGVLRAFAAGGVAAVLVLFFLAVIPMTAEARYGHSFNWGRFLAVSLWVVIASLVVQCFCLAGKLPLVLRAVGCYLVWCLLLWSLWQRLGGFWWCENGPVALVPSASCLFLFVALIRRRAEEIQQHGVDFGRWGISPSLAGGRLAVFGMLVAAAPLVRWPFLGQSSNSAAATASNLLLVAVLCVPLGWACYRSAALLYRLPCPAVAKLALSCGAILLSLDLWLRALAPRSYPSGHSIGAGLGLAMIVLPLALLLLIGNVVLCLAVHSRCRKEAGITKSPPATRRGDLA